MNKSIVVYVISDYAVNIFHSKVEKVKCILDPKKKTFTITGKIVRHENYSKLLDKISKGKRK